MKTFIWSRFHNLIFLNGHNKSGIEIIKPRNHAFGVDDVEVFIPADVQIITFLNDRQHTNQMECVTKSINADGSPGTLTITFPRQGGMVKLQPPSPKFMSYVETIVKPGEWYATFMMNGVQIQLIHKVISEDGKTARATITGVGLDGKPVEEVLVLERQ